jgi:hypothetical protein
LGTENELDALIVKHIVDIEGAQRRLTGVLDQTLLREANAAIARRADKISWFHEFDANTETLLIGPEQFIQRDGTGGVTWQPWLELGPIDADGELLHVSHLAEFLDLPGGSTRKGLSFRQDALGKTKWRALLRESAEAIEGLRALGFEVNERQGTISLPLSFDAVLLQKGLLEDDLEPVMSPIETAFDKAVEALPYFQLLATAIRSGREI